MSANSRGLFRVPIRVLGQHGGLCVGLTTFNCLRNSGARAGGVVAVLELGGLGHVGFSLPRRWVLERSASREEGTRSRSRETSARTTISTVRVRTPPQN